MTSTALAAERWIARSIPPFLLGITGYSIYVVVYSLSIDYLLLESLKTSAAIAILVVYFTLFLPYIFAFIRLLSTMADPGYIPIIHSKSKSKEKALWLDRDGVLEGTVLPPRGIERFYAKDAFICDARGLPKFCDRGCYNWKPARTHHCSQVGRCVRRMDHFCPWVGGVVAEGNTNFFIQFTFYAALFCGFILGVMIWALVDSKGRLNGHWIAMCACAGLFGFMALGLFAVTTFQNEVKNVTTVEGYARDNFSSVFVAVYLPHGYTPRHDKKPPLAIITYPLPRESLPDVLRKTFAVIECGTNDRLWDLGSWLENLKSVMGERYIDWFIPIRRSPCCSRGGDDYDYPFGRALRKRKREYGL
ncbi:hypothetical protein EJ08DRAFT_185805 [Tothia fuscella]|uniref:Palmitoyltransferase n=1 Tax=Tothia fuscella TaxID=1048955 RepID=A0A9P4TZH0_9PEZI|nr:hypothetical protein EJ08DRAFT_185805 [Tothia fuscella]